jgi:hypothetical protein
MLSKSSRNLGTSTNGSLGLQIRNKQSMVKMSLVNSLMTTSPSHKKSRVKERQRMTRVSGATSTKAPCTTPMNITRNSHWWSRSKIRSQALIQNMIQIILKTNRSTMQTVLLLLRPQQFNQKNQ